MIARSPGLVVVALGALGAVAVIRSAVAFPSLAAVPYGLALPDAGDIAVAEPDGGPPGGSAPPIAPVEEEPDDVVLEPEPPPLYVAALRPPGRPLVELGFGIGQLDAVCQGCLAEGGLAIAFAAGVQVSGRVAFTVDLFSLLHLLPTDDSGRRGVAGHSQLSLAARTWLTPQLWGQVSAGLGSFHVSGAQDARDWGPGFGVALGHEALHRPRSGIDIGVRFGGTLLQGESGRILLYSLAALAGFHWN